MRRPFTKSKITRSLLIALALVVTCIPFAGPALATDYSTSQYWANATRTHAFTNASTTANPAGLWNPAAFNGNGGYKYSPPGSQYADYYTVWAAEANMDSTTQLMLTTGSATGAGSTYLSRIKATTAGIGSLWDMTNPNAGFNTYWNSTMKAADENSIAGSVYLDVYEALSATGGTQADKDAYLNGAKSIAVFLLGTPGHVSQLWNYHPTPQGHDGGFWWDTDYMDSNASTASPLRASDSSIRSTEVNANCAKFFADLYRITRNTAYRDAAQTTMEWLNDNLRDSTSGLYNWGVWEAPDTTTGATHHSAGLDKTKFSYDQSFVIEADIAMHYAGLSYGSVSGNYLTDAENLTGALVNPSNGLWTTNKITFDGSTYYPGFIQSKGWTSGVTDSPASTTFPDHSDIAPIFTGWVSEALIELYNYEQAQPVPNANSAAWLGVAKSNVDTLNSLMQTSPNSGKYYYSAAPDGNGRYTITNSTLAAYAQPYMEKTNAMLAPLFQ